MGFKLLRGVGRPPAGESVGGEGFRLGYRPALDGLRGVAILLVLAVHSLPWLVPGGFLGVDVFFVLSGFLITALLAQEWQRTGSIDFKAFYLRRALRLLPALAVLLVVCLGYSALFLSRDDFLVTGRSAAGALCYYSNWRVAFHPHNDMLMHTWSLSVEEQFYLLWPLVLGGMLWRGFSRRLILLLVALAATASAACRLALLEGGCHPHRLYMFTHTHADGLLAGCLVGLAACWGLLPRSRRARTALRAAALAAVLFLAWNALHIGNYHPYLYRSGFTLLAGSGAAVLAALLCDPPRALARVLEAPALVWVGRRSYGFYLWHLPVLQRCARDIPFIPKLYEWVGGEGYQFCWFLLSCSISLGAAALSYRWVEQPFLRWKDRLAASAPPPAAPLRRAGSGLTSDAA
jgi:peptidoglycan/LPS O-acetylase OafA/YrhL